MKKGKCKRCGQDKRIVSRELCSNCYRLVLIQEKKTGQPYTFPTPTYPQTVHNVALTVPVEARSKTVADLTLETIIKENKIKRIRLSFNLSIAITDVTVEGIS